MNIVRVPSFIFFTYTRSLICLDNRASFDDTFGSNLVMHIAIARYACAIEDSNTFQLKF